MAKGRFEKDLGRKLESQAFQQEFQKLEYEVRQYSQKELKRLDRFVTGQSHRKDFKFDEQLEIEEAEKKKRKEERRLLLEQQKSKKENDDEEDEEEKKQEGELDIEEDEGESSYEEVEELQVIKGSYTQSGRPMSYQASRSTEVLDLSKPKRVVSAKTGLIPPRPKYIGLEKEIDTQKKRAVIKNYGDLIGLNKKKTEDEI